MFETTSAIYGLKYQSRCITAQLAQQEKHRFLVGTINPREENEVHLIEFDETANEIVCHAIYRHPYEVWSLATSPVHEDIFFSSYHTPQGFQSSLWRMPNGDTKQESQGNASYSAQELEAMYDGTHHDDSEVSSLQKICDFKTHTGLTRVVWHPIEGFGDQLVSLDGTHLRHFNLGDEGTTPPDTPLFEYKMSGLEAGCWDPHHAAQFVAVAGRDILAFDFRSGKLTTHIKRAHEAKIRDVDYNPNKPYHVVTGGDDRKIRIWDLRKPTRPLVILSSHTHWVWNVKYNRFHDQLILSAGTDSAVNLWSVVSISSAPLGDLEDPQNEKEGDQLIKRYDEHEDSVYSIAWSCYDAWIFASLSNDGRVVVSHVPPAEKYKILL